MFKKYIIILISILYLCIPIIHSKILGIFGFESIDTVAGNYQFTKSLAFIVCSSLIIICSSYEILKNKSGKVNIPKLSLVFIIILILSQIFAPFPYTNFFGDSIKGHSTLVFLLLIGIYIILIHSTQSQKEIIRKVIICSGILASIIAIKEYYLPSFDYKILSNRALGSFGHPNYLAGYLVCIFPFLYLRKRLSSIIISGLFIYTLILTKSIWGIGILFLYLCFLVYKKHDMKYKKILIGACFLAGILSVLGTLFYFGYTSKLHSFLSRYFIWETTIKIIFSDIKIFLFGGGLGSLSFFFDTFKSPYLYVFENFGFTADRPHNIFLNVWYHFGIFAFIALCLGCKKVFNEYTVETDYFKKNAYESLGIFLLFMSINIPGISHFLIVIFALGCIGKTQKGFKNSQVFNKYCMILLSIIGMISIIWALLYYREEQKTFRAPYQISQTKIYKNIQLENKEFMIFMDEYHNTENLCKELIKHSPSAENYLHCGNILWGNKQDIARKYYKNGLAKIPNLRDESSPYHDNIFIKYFIDGKRFFSEKYGNIQEVLKRIGE